MTPTTYPARPRNGGPLPMALAAGMDYSKWTLEPKVNGWRGLVHTPTGLMWNRHGEPLTIAKEFKQALGTLAARPFEWLDVEGLERRHGLMQGHLIVLDWITEGVAYTARRSLLERHYHELSVGCEVAGFNVGDPPAPSPDNVFLIPRYSHDSGIWETLRQRNHLLGCTFYEGVVAKKDDSKYPVQLRSASQEFPDWVKHRFTTL